MKTQDHIQAMLESLGLRASDDAELGRTPERVASLFEELFAGLHADEPELSFFDSDAHDPIVLLGLPFKSMCIHHLMPFFGEIDIAYVPNGKAAGFGGFLRTVDHFAKRPQVQERLVEQIASHLQKSLQPSGLVVRCRARQMCVEMRTNSAPATFVSTASRGTLVSGEQRAEVLGQFHANERQI